MERGIVCAGYGGFYQVALEGGPMLRCTARGKLKRRFGAIYAGDRVEVQRLADGGVVENILPRQNLLHRPKVANVRRAILVQALRDPVCDLFLLEKMIVVALQQGIEPFVCFNKGDLDPALGDKLCGLYRQAGFAAAAVSAVDGWGVDAAAMLAEDGITILAGPSGVGKSSLLNRLCPQIQAQVGDISVKLQRGKHTTRYVTLYPLPKGRGMLADTPGFSLLDLPAGLTQAQIQAAYPEFAAWPGCRFQGCRHDREPGCRVRQAALDGDIDEQRYQRYVAILRQAQEREEK
ncbi:MAG: ribosome small subunit-dependent GTPase A [Firmicutes bacterium]|nr:ribosome small subunit-dependent GTPase A [Bacillota bacterium]